MSAFVQSDAHLNAIITTCQALGFTPIKLPHGQGYYDFQVGADRMALGLRLREANETAVYERYDSNNPQDMIPDDAYLYVPGRMLTPVELYKAIAGLSYQCNEGDFEKTYDYILLEDLLDRTLAVYNITRKRNKLTHEQFQQLPVYQTAEGWMIY
jgi:hypothetical protein